MGDLLAECDEEGDGLFFTHSNCVLALPGQDGHALVRDFYARAAESPNEEILNPVHYASDEVAFIPEEARVRSYGCGSPVMDAALAGGETVVDLGSGTGVECFIAASQVGRAGRVVGIDMLPPMVERAERAAEAVAERLGYRNVEFHQSLLEALPLEDESVDCILSNCVINLSPSKRRAFSEMLRVLKPGGRIVISDVSRDSDVPLAIQYSEKLRGECLGGAFEERRLMQLLADVGFCQMAILKRFPYREVRGHQFYSLTFTARRPSADAPRRIIYRGPFAAAITDDGQVVDRGERVELPWHDGPALGDTVFVLDADGNVTNVEGASSCCAAPEAAETTPAAAPAAAEKHSADCMVCGRPLVYLDRDRDLACHYCGQTRLANATCEAGHFVCDACHSENAFGLIQHLLIQSTETDMIALLRRIRSDPAVPLHGPEHHALVPGIMVAAYRNAGGSATDGDIRTAVRRGATICGGACAFLGACGGAVGIGTGFAVLLRANPYKGHERGVAQAATADALREIAEHDAARCCQRDCWIALQVAARLSRKLLPVPLEASESLLCEQVRENRECMGASCPLWPRPAPEADAAAPG
jgi:SAM-dependent methyltransferase